jgi:uncharacterized membrane protein
VLVGGIVAGLAVYRRSSREALFVCGLTLAALGSLALPEVVAVKGDVGRMNTVFKFYLQAWILLMLLAGPCAVLMWRALFGRERAVATVRRPAAVPVPEAQVVQPALAQRATPDRRIAGGEDLVTPAMAQNGLRYAWAALLGLLILTCAVYPILATRTKLPLRFEALPPTMDGMAFMADATYMDRNRNLDLPSDWRAIRWVLDNVQGTPVIIEGTAPLYHWGSRFSIYTGLPAVIGWDWHQKQQRMAYSDRVDQRQRDVGRFYETTDPTVAWSILNRYGVDFIVVGGLERAYYPAAGLAKFDRMVGDGLDVVYRQGGVTIYQVTRP